MSRRQPGARSARPLAATALAAIALAVGVSAPATAQPLYGVVPQDSPLPSAEDMQLMPKGGIKSMRLMAHWPTIENVRGVYDWWILDAMVRETVRHGIEPLLYIYGTPTWAARADGNNCRPADCSLYPPSSPDTRRAFADFAAALVQRYGPDGDFWKPPTAVTSAEEPQDPVMGTCPVPGSPVPCPQPPPAPPPTTEPGPTEAPCDCTSPLPIRRWQLWNEQNSSKFFAPKPDVGIYAAMVKAAGDAIHQADPGADVILGGMWGPQSASKVVVPVRQYLGELYGSAGIADSFDSLALHPYAKNASGAVAQVTVARRVAKSHNDAKTGMWVTEIGWADRGPKSEPYVKGRQGQARTLSRAMKAFERRERRFHLRGVFWYSWRDRREADALCAWCAYSGLRTENGAAKPAWRAFKRVATR